MNDEVGSRVFMSIDLKKYCIRIHKACLHLIGDPKYIQILVNLDDMAVVIASWVFALKRAKGWAGRWKAISGISLSPSAILL